MTRWGFSRQSAVGEDALYPVRKTVVSHPSLKPKLLLGDIKHLNLDGEVDKEIILESQEDLDDEQ